MKQPVGQPRAGYNWDMEIPAFAYLGIVLILFIGGGLVWAFVADRKRNQRVAHDPERTEGTDGLPRHDRPS